MEANKKRSNRQKYDWQELFKKKSFEWKQGTDYKCMTHSIAQHVRNMAHQYGFRVSVRLSAFSLVVTVLGKTGGKIDAKSRRKTSFNNFVAEGQKSKKS